MKYFEFVCTRNEGRSPVAEYIATWYLDKIGIGGEYGAISSGSHRDHADPGEIQSTSEEDVPLETMQELIRLGIENGIFGDEVDMNSGMDHIRKLYDKTNVIFKNQERHFRADAVHNLVEEHNLSGYLKTHSNQTIQRKDVVAVFAMSPNNTEKVREIYENRETKPLIETLSVYVTGDPDAKLPNAFAQGQDFYNHVIEELYKQVPDAIDKFLSRTK